MSRRDVMQRADFPAGKAGQVLTLDQSARGGLAWRYPSMKSLVDLPGLHGGTLSPGNAIAEEFIGIPAPPASRIQFDAATAGGPWAAAAGVYEWPQLRVDALGVVHLAGVVAKPTAMSGVFGSRLFVMPVGLQFKGTFIRNFPVTINDAAGVFVHGRVTVWGSTTALPGSVTYAGPYFASTTAMSLEGISYLVEA